LTNPNPFTNQFTNLFTNPKTNPNLKTNSIQTQQQTLTQTHLGLSLQTEKILSVPSKLQKDANPTFPRWNFFFFCTNVVQYRTKVHQKYYSSGIAFTKKTNPFFSISVFRTFLFKFIRQKLLQTQISKIKPKKHLFRFLQKFY